MDPRQLGGWVLAWVSMLVGCASAPVHTAEGYGGAVFTADPLRRQIRVRQGGREAVFVEGRDLGRPQRLVLNGGQLIVGGHADLVAVDLRSQARTPLAVDIGGVEALAVDHVGYYIVATGGEHPLLRVTPSGEVTVLDVGDVTPSATEYDPVRRTLRVADAKTGRVRSVDYLELVGDDRSVWERRDARPMKPFVLHGVRLTGAEYWPNRGAVATRYPDDVLWGFYPEEGVVFEGEAASASATPAALACAQTAYDRLRSWIESHHERLKEVADRIGASKRFYLWVNDYSQADDPFPHPKRPAQLWYWTRKPQVVGRVVGYWKWESSVAQDGTCVTPDEGRTLEVLEGKLSDGHGD